MIRTIVVFLLLVTTCVVDAALGQTSTERSKSGSLIFVGKKLKDTTPPVITILEPIEVVRRGMKVARDSGVMAKVGTITVRGVALDSSGVAIVKVNDREALLKPVKGGVEFTAEVLLVFGLNVIEIEAYDAQQNEGKETIKVLREVVVPKSEASLPETKLFKGFQVWAAIVGISEYKSPDIPSLRYADRDAEAFYNFLVTPLEEGGRGVAKSSIRKLINKDATKTNIQEAIFDFMKSALEEDVAVIYFAGHGAPDPTRPNVPYLLAYDSDLARPAATAVKMQEVQDAIRDYIKAKKK